MSAYGYEYTMQDYNEDNDPREGDEIDNRITDLANRGMKDGGMKIRKRAPRGYRIQQWEDGTYHVYRGGDCLDEVLSKAAALTLAWTDKAEQQVKEPTMTDRPTQKQQIADLNAVIDRQAAQIGKMRKRLDAAGAVVSAAQTLVETVGVDLDDGYAKIDFGSLRAALEAARAAGFETE